MSSEMTLKDSDIKIERFNSGAGGQQQNKHPKNVRITHIPTGVVATIRGRNFHKNVAMAKKELINRLQQFKDNKIAANKKARRDQKIKEHHVIRTYDFSSGIVKDHRTGRKASIRKIMKGELDIFLNENEGKIGVQ